MKILISMITVITFSLALALSLAIPVQAQPQPQSQEMVKVLIGFRGSSVNAEQQMVEDAGGHIQHAYHRTHIVAATLPATEVQALRESANVAFIEDDGIVHALDQQLPWGVDRINAESVHSNNKGNGVKVAIIDTGIDISHPDLNVQGGISCVSYTTSWDDDNGHGSHVAGIVAALDNTTGVIGVAPEAGLYAVKVLDGSGTGNWSNVMAGIDWAIDNGMQVINMSIGGLSGSTALETACNDAWNAGIILVAAAGNNDAAGTVLYPAKYNSVIAVGATDDTNTVAGFSDIGSELELAAPGVNIYSTYKGASYATMSGTSMASPHVAGAAALLIASGIKDANGNGYINDEVRQRLDTTAIDLGSKGRDNQYGYGLVDAFNACTATTSAPTFDHYSVSSIGSPQTLRTPFSVTIQAQDKDNNNISNISESVKITFGKADAGSTPTLTSAANGAATIKMTMTVAQNSQTISFTGANSGKSGTSNSFSVNVATPSVPILNAPTNSSTVSNLTPRLEWNASTGAVSYGLQVSTSSSFTSQIINQTGMNGTYFDVPSGKLGWNTTYYWRVNATNNNGTSIWSAYQSFKTPIKPQPPTAPTLSSPATNSTVSNQTPRLGWNASTGAVSYGLQVSTSYSFTSQIINQTGINGTYFDVPSGKLSWNTTYYWRINATNNNGTSSWSAYRAFKTPATTASRSRQNNSSKNWGLALGEGNQEMDFGMGN